MTTLKPRMVLVHRKTELDELLDRHSTRGQAEFFLKSRSRSLEQVDHAHAVTNEARAALLHHAPVEWSVTQVERSDLPRFLFQPTDVIVVVGPDGLVANAAKYLDTQPVIGVNPLPEYNVGVLVPHTPTQGARIIAAIGAGQETQHRSLTMAQCELDDGQVLTALNEIYVGHASHQSARYIIGDGTGEEYQSSSGVLASTGTGATGWAASLAPTFGTVTLPTPAEASLAWCVREAWPSPTTGTHMVRGRLSHTDALRVTVQSEQLVAFGDGLEEDRLVAGWGQTLTISVSQRHLHMVTGLA